MSDLVERLRRVDQAADPFRAAKNHIEAADRIEKLESLINELEVHGNFMEIYLIPEKRQCKDWVSDAKELSK